MHRRRRARGLPYGRGVREVDDHGRSRRPRRHPRTPPRQQLIHSHHPPSGHPFRRHRPPDTLNPPLRTTRTDTREHDPHPHHPPHQRRPVGGHRRAHEPGVQPRHRRAVRRARPGLRRPRRRGRHRRPPGLGLRVGQHLARQAHPGALQVPRAAQRAQGGHRRAHHRRARQGPLRRPRRGDPWSRGRRVRVRHPAPAQGRLHRERLDQGRRLLDPPEPGRRGRHQPLQLPGHGPAVVRAGRDRLRQRRRHQAEREGPVGRQRRRRALEGGRSARRHPQRRARRQGGGRRAPHPPRRQGRLLRRLHADRAVRLRDGHGARQARAGPRRCEEPHARPAGRRPRPRGRRRGQRRLRLGRRALHGDLGPPRRRHHRRRPREKIKDRVGKLVTGDGTRGLRHGPARHLAAPRQGHLLPRRRHRGGRHARHRRPRGRRRLRRGGLLPQADPVRQRHA